MVKAPRTGLENGMLVGLGNPLLDISANVEPTLLTKYGLEPDNAILAEDKHKPLYKAMEENKTVEYVAGGATLNSIRVAQWLCGEDAATVFGYMGCIGKDADGDKLAEKAKEAGIRFEPQVNTEVSTGRCACLITGDGAHRSLVADLGAANTFKPTHFDADGVWSIITAADYFYIGGFFLTVSPESILKVAKHGCAENKYVTMNLSAPFICQFFADPMMEAFPYVDILFGNETEAVAFAKQQNFGTEDIKEIAKKAAKLEKTNNARERMVVFTQGTLPTVVAFEGQVKEYDVIVIPKQEIVDTNGAGDSFVGGFLNQFIQGKDIEKCVEVGHKAANYVIKQSGVTLALNGYKGLV